MRVLLIRPSGRFSSLVYPDGPWIGIPLGLCYLAGVARRAGHECRILDALSLPDFEAIQREAPPYLFGLTDTQIVAEAEAFAPDVIGLSVAAEVFGATAMACATALRKRFPKAVILAGGSDPSMQPDHYLEPDTPLDALVMGEGEVALEAILSALANGQDWRGAPSLAFRVGDKPMQRTPRAEVANLDACPPDWSDLPFERYFDLTRRGFPSRQGIEYPDSDRAVYLVTSRGCPYRCSFCSIQLTMGHAFRTHGDQMVLDMVLDLVTHHGVRHIHFEDDNLSFDRPRLVRLLEGLCALPMPITWDTPNGVRADRFDRELVALCKRSGCVYLMFGVESGSQAVLDEIANKELRLEDVEATLDACKAEGLETMALFIFGLPGETREQVLGTYRYAFELRKRFDTIPFFSIYKPYPGTPLYDTCVKNRWLIDARPYERMGQIPYMLFMPIMAETPEVDIWFVMDLYQRYMVRFAAAVIWRASRVMFWHPILMLRLNLRLCGRLIRHPSSFMPSLRAWFWRVLLFPRAQVRIARRGRLPASVPATVEERA